MARTLPAAFCERYTGQLHNLSDVARSRLVDALSTLNAEAPNFRDMVANLFVSHAKVSAEAAAQIALAFYQGASVYLTGVMPDVAADSGFDDGAAYAAAYAIEDTTASRADMERQLANAIGYQINRAANMAARNCGKQDKRRPKFARVPTGAETCAWCISTAGLGFHYMTEETASHTHSNCVVGDTRVSGNGLLASMRREYQGALVNIVTAKGRKLTITPNHPILTTCGWKRAGELVEGDGLLCAPFSHWHGGSVPNENDAPPSADELFKAARFADSTVFDSMPAATKDFYSEMFPDCDVNVISPNGLLERAFKTSSGEPLKHFGLAAAGGDDALSGLPLNGNGALDKLGIFWDSISCGFVRGGSLCGSLLGGHSGSADDSCFGAPARIEASVAYPTVDNAPVYTDAARDGIDAFAVLESFERFGVHGDALLAALDTLALQDPVKMRAADSSVLDNLVNAYASQVEVDSVSSLCVTETTCHVYNLSTKGGWYLSSGIITHNCDCRIVPSWGGSGVEGYDPNSYADYWRAANDRRQSGNIPDDVQQRIDRARDRARESGKPWSDDLNGTEIVMRWMYGMK